MNNTSDVKGGLIKLGGNLEQPRDSKPSDYPSVGPRGAAGESSGAGKLVDQTLNQTGPQHAQDGGIHEPATWGKADWVVGKSRGEGGSPSTSLSIKGSIDLETGQMSPCACDQTY